MVRGGNEGPVFGKLDPFREAFPEIEIARVASQQVVSQRWT